jgi:hypothetical protein
VVFEAWREYNSHEVALEKSGFISELKFPGLKKSQCNLSTKIKNKTKQVVSFAKSPMNLKITLERKEKRKQTKNIKV